MGGAEKKTLESILRVVVPATSLFEAGGMVVNKNPLTSLVGQATACIDPSTYDPEAGEWTPERITICIVAWCWFSS